MSRFKAKTNVLSLFLAFILISGTITAFYPSSSFIVRVEAQSYYDEIDF
ncbi:MAG TPA: hypothetical protein VJ583_08930 [Nitrososphaeraceae archaeon]|nr:hypothetical protein [Nitrososphaeraceae archaeon]